MFYVRCGPLDPAHNPCTKCIRRASAAVAATPPRVCAASQCWNVPGPRRADLLAGMTWIDAQVHAGAIFCREKQTNKNSFKINNLMRIGEPRLRPLVGLARQTYVQFKCNVPVKG